MLLLNDWIKNKMTNNKNSQSDFEIAIMNVINKDPLRAYDVFMQEIGELRSKLTPMNKEPNGGLVDLLKEISYETEVLLTEKPVVEHTKKVM